MLLAKMKAVCNGPDRVGTFVGFYPIRAAFDLPW